MSLVLFAALASGCASARVVSRASGVEYPETRYVRLLEEKPGAEFVVLGVIEGRGRWYNRQSGILGAMQRKGGQLGAHALMLMAPEPPGEGTPAEKAGGPAKRRRAVAIRYLDDDHPP